MRRNTSRSLLTLGLLIAATLLAAPAQAHHIPSSDAESRWYYVFNDHCGNGFWWTCSNRNTYLACSRVGEHSHNCTYQFIERYGPRTVNDQRRCTIWGQLTHTTVASWSEACGGWF